MEGLPREGDFNTEHFELKVMYAGLSKKKFP